MGSGVEAVVKVTAKAVDLFIDDVRRSDAVRTGINVRGAERMEAHNAAQARAEAKGDSFLDKLSPLHLFSPKRSDIGQGDVDSSQDRPALPDEVIQAILTELVGDLGSQQLAVFEEVQEPFAAAYCRRVAPGDADGATACYLGACAILAHSLREDRTRRTS